MTDWPPEYLNWRHYVSDATFLFFAAGAGFVWLLWRFERQFEQLRRQVNAVGDFLRIEIAQSAGDQERAEKLREQWVENREEEKKEDRLSRIGLGFWVAVYVALGFAYWWFTQHSR
jgi:hypothetical protein